MKVYVALGCFLLIGHASGAPDIPREPNARGMCAFNSSEEMAAWSGPVASGLTEEGTPFLQLTRDRNVLHAVRQFKGKAANWANYAWLRLEVESNLPGTLNITFREPDGRNLEPWIAVARLSGRRESIWIHLAVRPEGDLILGGPQWDREWNPDAEKRLTMTLTPGTGWLRVFAVELVRDRKAREMEPSPASSVQPIGE